MNINTHQKFCVRKVIMNIHIYFIVELRVNTTLSTRTRVLKKMKLHRIKLNNTAKFIVF